MSATKHDLEKWVLDALNSLGGSATIVEICKYIWENHEGDLKSAGALFYTWQYDMRWAAQTLQDKGKLVKGEPSRNSWSIRKA